MPFVDSDGRVVERRSIWRLSIISDTFWAILDFFGLFFDTLINPTKERPKRVFASDNQRQAQGQQGNGGAATFRGHGPKGSNIKTLPKSSCGPKGG
jgi:hypothetical protein